MFKAVVFDAYGTLFDVHSVTALADRLFPGQGAALSQLWRDKQIEYSRLVTMSDPSREGSRHYQPFEALTRAGLRYACRRLGLELSDEREATLMAEYACLAPFDDVAPTLAALRRRDLQTAILSNGNRSMLEAVVAAAGLADAFDAVISVEAARQFKTSPAAYELVAGTLAADRSEVLFVSSNGWDALGATWFGLRTFWVNRGGLPFEEIGPRPWASGKGLADLLPLLAH